MRQTLILVVLFALPLATAVQADSHDETPNDEATASPCPDTHYECGTGICCPKE